MQLRRGGEEELGDGQIHKFRSCIRTRSLNPSIVRARGGDNSITERERERVRGRVYVCAGERKREREREREKERGR